MHLFINSLAASAGGGLTYIRNVLPLLALRPDVRVTIALTGDLRREFPALQNVDFVERDITTLERFWFEQTKLGGLIGGSGAEVLLSAGNFAMRHSPVPQILLSRNSIYTSEDYFRDLRERREYRMWVDTHLRGWLAKKSVEWADATVTPSETFAEEVRRWTGRPVQAIHHGFDAAAFAADSKPMSPELAQMLQQSKRAFKVLFVSHYNYYRNFETLLRALPLLPNEIDGRPVKLLLTCRLYAEQTPGAYRPDKAARIVQDLGLTEKVLQLGSVPYDQLHYVYREVDLYVTPAYTETFAHPLVEAMASGLPIVASDLPVHREICQEAAAYFPRFSSEAMAQSILQIATSPDAAARMKTAASERVRQFSWKKHVGAILELSSTLVKNGTKLRKLSVREAPANFFDSR